MLAGPTRDGAQARGTLPTLHGTKRAWADRRSAGLLAISSYPRVTTSIVDKSAQTIAHNPTARTVIRYRVAGGGGGQARVAAIEVKSRFSILREYTGERGPVGGAGGGSFSDMKVKC